MWATLSCGNVLKLILERELSHCVESRMLIVYTTYIYHNSGHYPCLVLYLKHGVLENG
jgi:hypothetical protein